MRNVPKLRFKEFTDEWEKIKLKEILEFKNGINASKEQYGKGIKFINVLDILNNDFITYDNIIGKVDIDEKTLDKYSVNYGDILFQRSSETREEVGMANVYLDDKTATFGGFVIRGKKIANYVPTFINKVLKTDLARNEITSKSGGSTRYNVGQDILNEVQIIIPTIKEQEKIADFLLNVDKKISITEEKLNLFNEYKKGIMQKIFNQELRFKDANGNDYPEWKEKKLGDIFTEISERNPEDNSELLSVSINNGVQKRTEIDAKDNSSEDKSKYKKVEKYDIVYNTMRMWQGAVGVSHYKGIASPAYTVIRLKENNNIKYFEYLFKTNYMIYLFKKFSQGLTSDTWNLKFDKFKEIEIKTPYIDEQQKIADFLSAIDTKIEKISDELENLKEFKKGLLQQMFV